MKAARAVVLGVAVVAGGLAAFLMSGNQEPQQAPQPKVVQLETVDVLVAKKDIGTGQILTPEDVQWQQWPAATASHFIRRSDKPEAIKEVAGSIARFPLQAGEPLREQRLVRLNGSGFMAAILPSGMRAISTEISPETGAGGFILPNDRVDVILSRRDREQERASGIESHISETILPDVKVLAIDQTIEEKNGQRVVVGKTATLELTQRQAESLAMSRQMGTLTLALRSIADSSRTRSTADDNVRQEGRMNMVRYGVTTSVLPK
jgi:pilus assembly protein CpaB